MRSTRILNQHSKKRLVVDEDETESYSQSSLEQDEEDYNPTGKKKISAGSQYSQVSHFNNQHGLSAYEKMIQANIDQRMHFLKELNIFEAKSAIEEVKPTKKAKPANKIKKTLSKPTEKRRSQRLQNLCAVDDHSSFERKKNIETWIEEKPSLPDPGPKELQGYYKFDDLHESSTFIDSLKNLKVKNQTHLWSRETKLVKMTLNSMVNNEDFVAKVLPSRIYSIKIHPTTDKTLIFAGGSGGELGIWDVNEDQKHDICFRYNIHSRAINCMSVDKFEHNNLHTNSYDGSLRRLHLPSSIVQELYRCNEEFYISWHAQKDAHSFVISGSDGFVDYVDTRASKAAVMRYRFDNNKSVKVVAIHPVKDYLMSTASSNGSVCLWDLRKMIKNPLSQVNHHRTVHGLEFSSLAGNLLVSTCADNNLWLMKIESETLQVVNKIRHNNKSGRWLTTFKASWLPGSEELFVIGSMDHPRKIEIWDANGNQVHSFRSEWLQSVASVNSFHPHKSVLAGGNASGRVFVFLDKTKL